MSVFYLIFRCDRITRDIEEHLATCTYPFVRHNIYYEDSPFCPFPPSVSVTKEFPITANWSEPLDMMSYFVDERLIEMADDGDPVQFFREYMAGFVVSKRESAVSRCGSIPYPGSNDITVNDTMCYMLSTTPVVRTEPIFSDTIERQYNLTQCTDDGSVISYEGAIFCVSPGLSSYTDPNSGQYPICSNTILTSTTFGNTEHYSLSLTNTFTNYTMIDDSFEVDGAIRFSADMVDVPGDQLFGRVHAPYDDNNAEVIGATVFYNNQVIMSVWVYCKTGNFGVVKLRQNLIQRILTKEMLTKC